MNQLRGEVACTMPKLSSFVKKKAETSDQRVKREEEERGHAHGGRSSAFKKTGESQVRKDRLLPGTVESGSGRVQTRPAVPVPSKAPQPARPEIGIPKKTLDEYIANKVFRWPDGSLRKEKPPAKKEVVLARKDWDDLVLYCRRTGGCPDCTKGKKQTQNQNRMRVTRS